MVNEAKVRYGFQLSEINCISSWVWQLYNSLSVFLMAISPSGTISGDCKQNIRYTSMLQVPTPLMVMSSARISCSVLKGNVSKSIFNFGAGVYAYSDKFWFGASMPYFLKSKWSDGVGTIDPFLANHWFVSGGGVLDVSIFQIKPSLMIKKSSAAPVAFETGCSVYAFSKFGLGVNYRIKDALMFIGEFQINDNFRLAYGYEQTTSGLRNFNNGTHEILLRYNLNNGGKATSSPRLF